MTPSVEHTSYLPRETQTFDKPRTMLNVTSPFFNTPTIRRVDGLSPRNRPRAARSRNRRGPADVHETSPQMSWGTPPGICRRRRQPKSSTTISPAASSKIDDPNTGKDHHQCNDEELGKKRRKKKKEEEQKGR